MTKRWAVLYLSFVYLSIVLEPWAGLCWVVSAAAWALPFALARTCRHVNFRRATLFCSLWQFPGWVFAAICVSSIVSGFDNEWASELLEIWCRPVLRPLAVVIQGHTAGWSSIYLGATALPWLMSGLPLAMRSLYRHLESHRVAEANDLS